MRPTLESVVETYQRSLYSAAYSILQNSEDANDVVQDTFLQYHLHPQKQFNNDEHVKAWLLRVAINRATDLTRNFWRRFRKDVEDIENLPMPFTKEESLFHEAVIKLPAKTRIIIHLYYYEDYKIHEIADILKMSESGIKMRLSRGRTELKQLISKENTHER